MFRKRKINLTLTRFFYVNKMMGILDTLQDVVVLERIGE